MRAWQFTEVGAPLTLNEVPTPDPAEDEVPAYEHVVSSNGHGSIENAVKAS